MMHRFSPFGRNNESRMREHRLIFEGGGDIDPKDALIAQLQAEGKEKDKKIELVSAKLQSKEDAEAHDAALVAELKERMLNGYLPEHEANAGFSFPHIEKHSLLSPARTNVFIQQNYPELRSGNYPLPITSQNIIRSYTPYVRASLADRRRFHNHNPTAAHFGQSYASRRNIPNSTNWSAAAADLHILRSGGSVDAPGMRHFIPTTVRTDGQNAFIPNGLSPSGGTSSMRTAKIHERLTMNRITNGWYRDLDGVPAAEEAFRQYEMDMMITPRESHNHAALLRTRLDKIRTLEGNKKTYSQGRELRKEDTLEKRYFKVGDELDAEIRIQVPSENVFGEFETIRFKPNSIGLVVDDHSAKLAQKYGIFCEPETVNGRGRGATIHFTKPGSFDVAGKKVIISPDRLSPAQQEADDIATLESFGGEDTLNDSDPDSSGDADAEFINQFLQEPNEEVPIPPTE